MDEKRVRTTSSSGKREGAASSSSKPQGSRRAGGKASSSSERLKAKEEEYRRMNAELEAKTTELVKEAEELLEGNLSILSDLEGMESRPSQSRGSTRSQGSGSEEAPKDEKQKLTKSTKRPNTTASPYKKPHSQQQKRPVTSHHTKTKPPQTSHDASHDPASMDSALLASIRQLEAEEGARGTELALQPIVRRNQPLPPTVDDMGAEATIRFLKAKLKVMQEEMDQLCEENTNKDKLVLTQEGRIKELEASKAKLQASVQSSAAQLEKHRKNAEEYKQKSLGLEGQLTATRKELDALKGAQKKSLSQQSAVEVRLNRALEEVERYRDALHKERADAKESGKVEKQKLEDAMAENRQLERQRSELMVAFKKQLKLIDILKRQKIHIEAAKLLSFTEEEFVKALDWGAS